MSDASEWAVAVGTLALAGVTGWMAWKTRDVAEATRQAAKAAADEAKASAEMVAEIRLDRELNWRPQLMTNTGFGSDEAPGVDKVLFRVMGQAPAFNCIYARLIDQMQAQGRQVPGWRVMRRGEGVTVEPGPEQTLVTVTTSELSPIPYALFEDAEGKMQGMHVAIFYQDALGQRAYRELPPKAMPEVWSPGDKVPQWVAWYFGWINTPIPSPKPAP